MAEGRLSGVRQYLRKILGPSGKDALPDGGLLERYVRQRDEDAFAALVQRYGSLVLGVCERVLGDATEAEDAFQATFLVLVRKAGSLDRTRTLSHWLYTVAYRTAVKARFRAARRRAHEKLGVDMAPLEPVNDPGWKELRPVLDEELNRLPEKYRAPLVLCYLEGKTHLEAARDLGWPSGSVSRRMSRARELLRKRLIRRGVVLAPTALGLVLAQNAAHAAVPSALAATTIKAAMVFKAGAAAGAVSTTVATLAEEVLRATAVVKLKLSALLLPAACLCGMSVALGGLATRMALPESWLTGEPAYPDYPNGPHGTQLHWIQRSSFDALEDAVLAVACNPAGDILAVGTRHPDDTVKLWDEATGKELRRLAGHTGSVHALAFSPDGLLLASASQDRTVRIWEVTTGRLRMTLRGHEVGVLGVAFSPDGQSLATGSLDRTVRLWDLASGTQKAVLTGHRLPVNAVSYSPNGSLLASAGQDGTICLWNARTGVDQGVLEGHGDVVSSVAFSPDGRTLASGSWDATVKLWDVTSRQERATLTGNREKVRCVGFTPDGGMVVAGGQDRTVHLWPVAGASTGWGPVVLEGHRDSIYSLAICRSTFRITTGGADRSVKVWELGPYLFALR